MRIKRVTPGSELQRGQAIVLVAFAMVALLAFGVLAIDGSRFYDNRRTSQNAADMSSLAGEQIAFADLPGVLKQYGPVQMEINRVAEINGIPDSDGVAGNAVNANVKAWWINDAGRYITAAGAVDASTSVANPPDSALIDAAMYGTSHIVPTGTTGILVRVQMPYRTFVGGVIGQAKLQAQADSISRKIKKLVTVPPDDGNIDLRTTSLFVGGEGCTTALLIATTKNSNSFDLGANAYIIGNGGQGGGNSNQGLFKKSPPDTPILAVRRPIWTPVKPRMVGLIPIRCLLTRRGSISRHPRSRIMPLRRTTSTLMRATLKPTCTASMRVRWQRVIQQPVTSIR